MSLRAGAAMIDTTPALGVHLGGSGMGEHRPAKSVLDPLYAKALVVEAEGRRIAIVTLDTIMVTEPYTQFIRTQAAERYGIDPEAVMVHSLQIHSTPGCGLFMLDPDFPIDLPPEQEYLLGAETPYCEHVAAQAVAAIGEACAKLEPVQMGMGSAIRGDLAFNRRAVTRDGGVAMPFPSSREKMPLGPTNIRYMEGPIDPEVGVVCFRNEAGVITAMLLHHTCHPVNVFANRESYYAVSADWPGAWAQGMRDAHGEQCVPLVLNGCCGNINPWDPFEPDYVADHRRQGAELARTACDVVERMSFDDANTVDWKLDHVRVPYRDIPEERRAAVERILSEHLTPKWSADNPDRVDGEWFLAASTRSFELCRRREPRFPYEVQALRIGGCALVGLPGEPFVEGQLAIKLASPAYPTYVAHGTSYYAGYVPTRDAYARGGHEANAECTYWAKLGPGALESIVDRAGVLLSALF